MAPNGPPSGPTVRRLIVGSQLRRFREAAGLTRAQAGFHIRGSESKISRLELGRVSFKDRDVTDLLKLYGIPEDDERIKLLAAMAEEANQPGWWQQFDDVMAKWFQTYVGLEEAAELIRTYEIQFVPGLLQTEEYARAVIANGLPLATDEEIERRVQVRMQRQRVLERADPPKIWTVMDEAALRRPMGGATVIRAQIEQLIRMADRPNITIQVIPLRHGAHTTPQGGAFTVLRFADPDLSDIVYLEQLMTAVYLDKMVEADAYNRAFSQLCVDGLEPGDTVNQLKRFLAAI